MKIKNLLLLFLLLFSISEISAQKNSPATKPGKSSLKINVKWGAEYKNTKDEAIQDIIYDDGQNIYANVVSTKIPVVVFVYGTAKVTPSLVKYDSKMTPIKRKEYGADDKNTLYHGTFYIKGKFFILTSTFDSKTNTRQLYAEKFNTDLEPEGGKIKLWKIVGQKGVEMDFGYRFSQDSSKFLVTVVPELKKTENKTFMYKVFDQDLKDIYERTVKLNVPYNQAIIKNIQINNKSEVFVLFKMYNDDKIKEQVKSESGNKVPGYKYVFRKYATDESENKYDVDLKDKFMSSYYITTDPNGNLKMFLSYEEVLDDGISGFMNIVADAASGNILTKTDYPVTPALAERIDKMQDDRPSKKKPVIHNFFSISDYLTMDDGSSNVIVEKNYIVSGKYGPTYFSDGMIVFKIDDKGEFKWCTYIPKRQFFNSLEAYIHHTTMCFNNKLYIFYNDEPKNENYNIINAPKPPEKYNGIKDVSLMMVEFDDAGKPLRTLVGNTQKLGTTILMSLSKQLSPSRMVLCGETMNHFGGNRQSKLGVADLE